MYAYAIITLVRPSRNPLMLSAARHKIMPAKMSSARSLSKSFGEWLATLSARLRAAMGRTMQAARNAPTGGAGTAAKPEDTAETPSAAVHDSSGAAAGGAAEARCVSTVVTVVARRLSVRDARVTAGGPSSELTAHTVCPCSEHASAPPQPLLRCVSPRPPCIYRRLLLKTSRLARSLLPGGHQHTACAPAPVPVRCRCSRCRRDRRARPRGLTLTKLLLP